ncbi:helix-turn-helix transcriptional regulator [Halovulum sp. GXIMD14794]
MSSEVIGFNRAAQLKPFLMAFEQSGGDIDELLRGSGLNQFDLSDPATLITGNALYQAVQDMSDTLGDSFFGARVAAQFVESGPVFVRESYEASHTLAEFLPLMILELGQQISNIRYSLSVNNDVTVLRGERSFVPTAPIIQADAAAVSLWIALLRITVGEIYDPSRLLVTVQKRDGIPTDSVPQSSILIRKWNGISVGFPSAWLRCSLDLGWHFPQAPRGEFRNETAQEAVLTFVAKVCADRLSDKAFAIEEFASHLGTNSRNIQRTLARLGTSFQGIRDDVRRQKALILVSSGEPLVNAEIAEALGFSSAPSFNRAFKRWTGVSPAEFRANR